MARRKPDGGDNQPTMEKFSYRQEETTGAWERAVYDETTHGKLDAVLGALGGSADTVATIYNLSIINSNQEYSQVLPTNTKSFLLRSRNNGKLRLAYNAGGTNLDYLTIPIGANFKDTNFYTSIEIFVQSTKPGDIIEIVAYS